MGHRLKSVVRASFLAEALDLPLIGEDGLVAQVCALDAPGPNALLFSKIGRRVESPGPVVVIAPAEVAGPGVSVLRSSSPRLDFALALQLIEREVGFERPSGPSEIHSSVRVGSHVVIGEGCRIGEGTRIYDNVVIAPGVRIGRQCVIKSCAVIGQEGFGFERDRAGRPVRLPHLGSVIVGDHVEIGSLTTVCCGTMADTILEDYVKIDDHVHIAHNCVIREGAFVIACAEVSGGAEVGKNAWIGPNASVLQKVKIGAGALVGLGAVVLRDVEAGATVVGNPAKPLIRRREDGQG